MAYLIGAALGMATAAFGWLVGFDRSRTFYPVVLIVSASYYELFAAIGGPTTALWLEAILAAAFLLVAVSGYRFSLWLVVGGLVAHALLDAVHVSLIDNAGVPPWWPAFCLSFDVALGGCIALRLWRFGPRRAATSGAGENSRAGRADSRIGIQV
jgi:hypothetical protein